MRTNYAFTDLDLDGYTPEEPEFEPVQGELCETCGGQLYIAYVFGFQHLDDNPLTVIKCFDCGFYDTE